MPKNLLSWATGGLARLELPGALGTGLVRAFANTFKLDLREAELPLEHYPSIEALFTRRLRPGVRPVLGPLASPADGYIARSAPASAQEAVQAKGLTFSLVDLVYGGTALTAGHEAMAWYQTVYLAPHNYHRVHAPFSGQLTAVRYLPGELWPVNQPFVRRIPRLFSRNERLVFDFTLASGGRGWVVMVGALNVGRMVTPWAPDLVTNSAERQRRPRPAVLPMDREVLVGDELGTFMLGSTVVVVLDQTALAGLGGPHRLLRAEQNRPILMGQSLLRGDHD